MEITTTNRSNLIYWALILIMAIRICSYFTLFPDSVGVTRVVKIGLRFMMTGISFALLWVVQKKLKEYIFHYTNSMAVMLYLCYFLLGMLSILWSTEVHFTILQLLMLFECIVFICFYYKLQILYDTATNGHCPMSLILGFSITLISIGFLIGLYVDPSTFYRDTHGGAVSRLGGFIINPNELGMLAVIGATMNYVQLKNGGRKVPITLAWAINVAVLLLTQSRSSLGAFLLVTLIFVLISGNIKLQMGTVVAGIIVLPILVQTIIIKDGDVGEVMSMTGRLPFWSDLITHGFPDRPILGYGFMSISPSPFTNKFDSIHSYAASMTHNTFVQVLINLGLVGMFIVLFQMIATFYAAFTSKLKDLKLMGLSMLIPVMINSATEFGIFGEMNYGILFYHLIILFYVIHAKKKPLVITKNYFRTDHQYAYG